MAETMERATGTSPARDLLTGLQAGLDQLVAAVEAGELRRLDDMGLLEFTSAFEQLRGCLSRVDHQVVAAVDASTLDEMLVAGSTTQVLTRVARVSRVEASRRVHAAEVLGGPVSLRGDRRPPRRPVLAGVCASGRVPVENTQVAVGCLRKLERTFFATEEQLGFAEAQLAEAAVVFGPEELRRVAQHVEDVLFPDGLLADEQQVADAREITLTPKTDGSYLLAGRLTGLCGAAVAAVLTSLSAPVPGPDGTRDPRSAGQRRHDAVHTAAMMLLRTGELPRSGGVPASIVVTVDADDLVGRAGPVARLHRSHDGAGLTASDESGEFTEPGGHGTTSDGGRLTVAEIMQLADEAELLPTLLTRTGIVLSMGRTRRCATEYQTKALIARDGGCSFPHCTAPPSWCDRHHIIAWRDDGPTDLTNLTLLCGYHHAYFEAQRWACILMDGLPHWIPPRWVDADQTPILHERIRARHTTFRVG